MSEPAIFVRHHEFGDRPCLLVPASNTSIGFSPRGYCTDAKSHSDAEGIPEGAWYVKIYNTSDCNVCDGGDPIGTGFCPLCDYCCGC